MVVRRFLEVRSVLAALSRRLASARIAGSQVLWQALSMLVSFGGITLMFALPFNFCRMCRWPGATSGRERS